MTSAKTLHFNKSTSYLSPSQFAEWLSAGQAHALFLDIDGTLAEFTLNPKDSFIPQSTLALLQQLQNLGINIAIVTGRSLSEAKQMLSPLKLPIAATHGLEIDFANESVAINGANNVANDNEVSGGLNSRIIKVDTHELSLIRQSLCQSCLSYEGLSIEVKPYSVALHYRQNPALGDIAATIVTKALKDHPNWTLKPGKFVWEIAPKDVNKGTAILTLLEKMQSRFEANAQLRAIFIGDDVTDEAGFRAVQNFDQAVQGIGIKVGIEPTCAHYFVQDIDEVRALLDTLLDFFQHRHTTIKC